VLETLRCIDDLLAPRGAGLEDVRLATLFAKTPGLIETYEKTARASGMPLMPVVPTVADVCRDELLVEVEAVAVKPL